jgi:hypothetical protein
VAPAAANAPVSVSAAAATARPYFSALSPWNERADGLPVDARSDQLLAAADQRRIVVESPGAQVLTVRTRIHSGGLYINTNAWTSPIVSDVGARPTKVFCRQLRCGPDSVGLQELPVPPTVNPDPRYDGWFSIIDTAAGYGYDLWRARRQGDGSISFQYVKRWALGGPGYSKPQSPDAAGARGSGLPLFAGVILRSELQQGVINHALAISLPGPARTVFVPPASTTDGVGAANSVPEGARIVLKPTAQLSALPGGDNPRIAAAIVKALRTYGAVVVDRAAVPTLYAQAGAAPIVVGNELQSLHLSDFDVVQLPPLLQSVGTPPVSAGSATGAGV